MTYPALELVKQVAKRYPSAWQTIEKFRKAKGVDLPDWDNRCYVPMAASLAIINDAWPKNNNANLMSEIGSWASAIAAASTWRLSKEVYKFSPELETMLYEQTRDKDEIPCSVFDNMPFYCIYIESQLIDGMHGFFVHFEFDVNHDHLELRFLFISEPDKQNEIPMIPMHIHLNCRTIEESFELTRQEAIQNLHNIYGQTEWTDHISKVENDKAKDAEVLLIARTVQLVLYICAKNAEIKQNPQSKPKRSAKIVDHGKEIRKWDVGLRIGQTIKSNRETIVKREPTDIEKEKGEMIERNSPRPHPRRGHWHHFWVGPRNTAERKLVLHWVTPTFVGVFKDEHPAVINKLK